MAVRLLAASNAWLMVTVGVNPSIGIDDACRPAQVVAGVLDGRIGVGNLRDLTGRIVRCRNRAF